MLDVALRGAAAYVRQPVLVFGALASAALWTALGCVAARPLRAIAAAVAGALMAGDAVLYRYYRVPLDRQVVASALHHWSDVKPVLVGVLPLLLPLAIVSCALEYVWLSRLTPNRRMGMGALAVLALALAVVSPRDATADLRALDSFALVWPWPRGAAPTAAAASLPPVTSRRDTLPSVLFIVTESVRAASYCGESGGTCPRAPEVAALVPDRIALHQMRAVASYTSVSVSALLTGLSQEGPRADVLRAPTLFDYARAARAGDARMTVAYWSAQSASVFEGDARRSVDSWVTLETLLGHGVEDEDSVVDRGMDRMLAAYATREMRALRPPFFLLLHFAGTHAPYFVDEARAPFQPWQHTVTWAGLPSLERAYENAIFEQDHSIAASVAAFFEATAGTPSIVVFTSDHGEAFGEHGAIHHGQNLYDEQIHVPAWIASRNGGLTEDATRNLASHEDAFVTHLDLVPTVLDALGVLDAFPVLPYRARLRGQSLLSPPLPATSPIVLTNCTGMFPCPVNTWGLLQGDRVLEAQPWDADWNCVDLRNGEEHATGSLCSALREASRSVFPLLPSGAPNRY